MVKGKKKAGAKKAQNTEEDEDWEALLEAESKVVKEEPAAPDAEKKEEAKATKDIAAPAPVDAAAAFLASQGLAPGGDEGDGEKKDNKKKKKKKKGGAGEPKAEEKVRILVRVDTRTLATNLLV